MKPGSEVPFLDGMDFGKGVDTLELTPRGIGVADANGAQPAAVSGGGGDTIVFRLQRTESVEDLYSALNLNTSVAAVFGLFGGDATFDFAESQRFHSFSQFAVASITVTKAFKKIPRPQLDPASDAAELVSTVVVFIGAGIENTKHYIGASIAWLLRHPEQLALVRADPSLLPRALEEILRLEPPVQIALPRLALQDTVVGGRSIPAGERVSAVIGAANRDPDAYPDPDRFDVCRDGPPNLSLASGAHYCTGAGLARLEANVAVERFLARFPSPRLMADTIPIRDDIRPSLRGYAALEVEV